MDQLQKRRKMQIIVLVVLLLQMLGDLIMLLTLYLTYIRRHDNRHHKKRKWDAFSRHQVREVNFERVVFLSNLACVENTRMDRELKEETQNLNVDADEANLDGTLFDSVAETQDHPFQCEFSPHTTTATNGQNLASTARGKRKRNGRTDVFGTDQIAENIEGLRKVYEDKLGELVLYFKNESDATNKKMQVFAELDKIEGLTATDRMRAGVIIMEKQHLIDCLFAIKPDLKYDFVQHIFASQNL